jgi:hypothetical protein
VETAEKFFQRQKCQPLWLWGFLAHLYPFVLQEEEQHTSPPQNEGVY